MENEVRYQVDMKEKKDKECSCPDNICLSTGGVMDGKNHEYDARSFWESLRYAVGGVGLIWHNERNFRIQSTVAILAVILAFILRISYTDWIMMFVVIAMVLSAEAFNSVIEAICDTIARDYRINVKYAKDVSAGAVLVVATISSIAGILIFAPYLITAAKGVLGI